MKNLFILAKNSLFTYNSKNQFYIIMLIVFCALAAVSSGIINGVQAMERNFFTKDISNEVKITGFYEGSGELFYYSESAVDNLTDIDGVESYKIDYNINKSILINGVKSNANAADAPRGFFGGKEFVWGRDFCESDRYSAIISEEKCDELTNSGVFDRNNPILECVIDGHNYSITVIGVFSTEHYNGDLDISLDGRLSQKHFILSGDIGRGIYDAEFKKQNISAVLTLYLADSRLVPAVADKIRELYGSVNVSSEYLFAKDYIELFEIINLIIAVLLIVIFAVAVINVHDVFRIAARSSRYNYAVMMTQGYTRARIAIICVFSFAINFVISMVIGLITGLVLSLIISASLGNLFSDYIGITAFLPNAYLALMVIGIFIISLIDIAITILTETRFDVIKELKRGQ